MFRSLAIGGLLGLAAAAAPAQTVDEIVSKNALARGGAPAWRAVQSMRFSGRMELGRGMTVPFRLELKRPRKMRLEFEFDGKTAVQTYDGATGWKLSPHFGRQAAEPLSDKELASAAGQAELDGPLIDHVAKGHQIELEGRATVEGRDTYQLRLTLKGGAVRHVYVDAETGLEALVETPYRLRKEDKPLRTYYRDYRAVGGLAVPHLLESRIEGSPRSHKLTITTVEINVSLADSRFGQPTPAAAPTAPAASTLPTGAPRATQPRSASR
jgi:outer membrane lipoprotein-sorting protein